MTWSQINPIMGAPPEDTEETKDKVKETTLFVGGFFGDSHKKDRGTEALAKVARTRMDLTQMVNRMNNICHFLEKGTLGLLCQQ